MDDIVLYHPTLGSLILMVIMRGEEADFVFWSPQTNKYYKLRELGDVMPEN